MSHQQEFSTVSVKRRINISVKRNKPKARNLQSEDLSICIQQSKIVHSK